MGTPTTSLNLDTLTASLLKRNISTHNPVSQNTHKKIANPQKQSETSVKFSVRDISR